MHSGKCPTLNEDRVHHQAAHGHGDDRQGGGSEHKALVCILHSDLPFLPPVIQQQVKLVAKPLHVTLALVGLNKGDGGIAVTAASKRDGARQFSDLVGLRMLEATHKLNRFLVADYHLMQPQHRVIEVTDSLLIRA
jgi:hypothetical protein